MNSLRCAEHSLSPSLRHHMFSPGLPTTDWALAVAAAQYPGGWDCRTVGPPDSQTLISPHCPHCPLCLTNTTTAPTSVSSIRWGNGPGNERRERRGVISSLGTTELLTLSVVTISGEHCSQSYDDVGNKKPAYNQLCHSSSIKVSWLSCEFNMFLSSPLYRPDWTWLSLSVQIIITWRIKVKRLCFTL